MTLNMQTSGEKKDYSISMLKAQTASLPFGLFAVAEAVLFGAVWGLERIKGASDILLPWYFLPLFFAGIVLHELIHGVTWKFASGTTFANIKFGFQWKTVTPYAHCTVPMPKRAYVTGALMPALLLGFAPFGVSMATGDGMTMIFGVLFTAAAVGDFLIVWLIRSVPWHVPVEDHPTNAGCYAYE